MADMKTRLKRRITRHGKAVASTPDERAAAWALVRGNPGQYKFRSIGRTRIVVIKRS